jgi:hypothetical protein
MPMDEHRGIPKLGLNISPKLALGNKLYMKKCLKSETETFPRQFPSLFTGF